MRGFRQDRQQIALAQVLAPNALAQDTRLAASCKDDRPSDDFGFGRAQAFKAFGGLLQLGIESTDAEPDQRRLHSVDDPTLLSHEALALAVGRLASSSLMALEKEINTFFRLTTVQRLREAFHDLPDDPDPKTVFLKLRELRNKW